MEKNGLYELALAGLLHDIGKFLQRRGIAKHHAEVAREYRDYFKSETVSGIDFGVVLKAVSNHHSPTNDFERIIQMADWFSASERDGDKDYNSQRPLASIFEQIAGTEKSDPEYFYKIVPLSKELAHPKQLSPEEREGSKTAEYRHSIEDGFLDEMELLNKRQNSAEAYFETLATLLKKYATLIPSSTNNPPDISLFEHLKTTAAIACVLYTYTKERGGLPGKNDAAFLLIGCEISGIQDFIYTIRSEKAAKSLRGRSFYVKLLSSVVERFLLDELGMLTTNVVLSGGGRSYLLAANTDTTRAALETAKIAVQHFLLSEFGGRLGLSIAWVDFSGNEFGTGDGKGSFAEVKKRLDTALRRAKLTKFKELLSTVFKLEGADTAGCKVCNDPNTSANEICDNCNLFIDIGTKRIRETNHFVETHEPSQIKFGIGSRQYFFGFVEKEELGLAKKIYFRDLEDSKSLLRAGTGALIFMPYPLAGSGKDFEELSAGARGIARLGYLKMDVDNLGKIFSIGLGSHATICRTSTLSFFIDYFFTRGVEEIANKHENLYLVYSGGDDLFMVGAWNEIISCAMEIRAQFEKWTCKNLSIGLSAGISFAKDKFPMHMSTEAAEDALLKSKSTPEKDRVAAFSEPLKWVHFKELIDLGENLSDRMASGKVSTALAYHLMFIKKNSSRPSLARARTDYILCRNVTDEATYKFLTENIHKQFPYIETPVQYAVWLNRAREEQNKGVNFK